VTKLLRSLMAYLRGEPKVWSVVRVPTIAEEDDRRLHRERDAVSLSASNTSTVSRGYALSTGIYHYEPLRPDRRKRLEHCGPVMNANYPRVSKLRSGGNCKGLNSRCR
jgi:transposase